MPAIVLAAAALVAATAIAQVAAASALPTSTSVAWGWGVVRTPATASYSLTAKNGRDSAGMAVTYQRFGAGNSIVRFPGISNGNYGVPLVTALTTANRLCVIDDWISIANGSDQPAVYVDCLKPDGTRVDTPFSTNLVIRGATTPDIAFLYAPCSSSGCSVYNDWNPTEQGDTVTRTGTGLYSVALLGMAPGIGNVQVSAQNALAIACHAVSLASTGNDEDIEVACRDAAGTLTDSSFTIAYARSVGLTGDLNRKAAFLLATMPTAASYHPDPSSSFSSSGMAATIKRSGPGAYVVTLPGMPAGGSAQVTAVGHGMARCWLTSIRTSTPQRIGVHCAKPGASSFDSVFSLTYTH